VDQAADDGLVADDLGEEVSLSLDALTPQKRWSDYVAGVADVLMKAGVAVPGADLLISSTVPVGAGVSSSAALEVATATVLLALADAKASGPQIASWTQQAENDFVGMPCGIMDQFASANGVEGAALLLDCRTLGCEPVELADDAVFLIVNSMIKHAHVSGAYAARRADCESAAHIMGVSLLRDASVGLLETHRPRLTGEQHHRARHVISEIARVEAAAEALRACDLPRLGALMNDSHESLRADMQVSIPALDRLARIARETPGVYGARMMGGGFGGCIIALSDEAASDTALASIRVLYEAETNLQPDAFICRAVGGAGEVAS
jgi:galactokinase